jgi:flagellar hook-length control protein FliK
MFEKMIGVSPPQVGKAQDSKVADHKDFLDSAKSKSYKNDFEKALKEKQQQHAEKKAEPDRKHPVAKKEDPKVAKKEKKSSGGIKKKMTDVDEKMVSNGMASVESEVETPVAKEEKPATIKVDNTNTKESAVEQQLPEAALAMKSLDEAANAIKDADAAELKERMQKVMTGNKGEGDQAVDPQTQAQAQAQPQAQAGGNDGSAEAELSAAVGLKQENAKANKELLGKLKEFEGAAAKPDGASDFEKNVLETLKKENSLGSGNSQFSQKDQGSGLDQKEKGDMKADLIGNQLHQSAGQSHSAFKNHLETSAAAGASTQADPAQLEAKREDNVNEIMKQAQYLVKKGGGEVTVKMSPEGMGQVQLKVVLENGKLNVEMQTQDKNVKKMIEESLSELKSGLAVHRLSLEHVKIDTVNATNADNSTQLQSNLNQNSEGRARDMWHESWQQNQHQLNQHRQKSSSEPSRASGLSAGPTGVASSQAQALRTYGGTKGAGLNRVA